MHPGCKVLHYVNNGWQLPPPKVVKFIHSLKLAASHGKITSSLSLTVPGDGEVTFIPSPNLNQAWHVFRCLRAAIDAFWDTLCPALHSVVTPPIHLIGKILRCGGKQKPDTHLFKQINLSRLFLLKSDTLRCRRRHPSLTGTCSSPAPLIQRGLSRNVNTFCQTYTGTQIVTQQN